MSRLHASAVVWLSLACAPVAAAQQDPAAVARILAVESTAPLRVTLKVDVGPLFNGAELDVFSSKGKTTAKAAFPKYVDMLLPGDSDWAYSKSTWDKQKAGSFEVIAKDPDGARWQVNQGDLTGVTLIYLRNNSEREVRVMGVDMKNTAAVKAMRDRVLSLRRIP